MNIIIRSACIEDIDLLIELGKNDISFNISKRVLFYERDEILEWIRNPQNNILYVAYHEKTLVGFYFCKMMSYRWAMLDNFYVIPEMRRNKIGQMMFDRLKDILQQRVVECLTTIIEPKRFFVESFLRLNEFKSSKSYNWYECQLL